jgi:hypothetical protein
VSQAKGVTVTVTAVAVGKGKGLVFSTVRVTGNGFILKWFINHK